MKQYYVVYSRKSGDSFGEDKAIPQVADALLEGRNQWRALTTMEKKKTEYFGVLYGEPDAEGCLIMDSAEEIWSPLTANTDQYKKVALLNRTRKEAIITAFRALDFDEESANNEDTIQRYLDDDSITFHQTIDDREVVWLSYYGKDVLVYVDTTQALDEDDVKKDCPWIEN